MLLTEKSREEEKLSFKEQILRDLERVKEQERSRDSKSDGFIISS